MKRELSAILGTMVLATACMTGVAQQTNEQARQDIQAQAKQNKSVDKAQQKADKAEYKAAKSHKVKKAVKEQDKADSKAAKADTPPQ